MDKDKIIVEILKEVSTANNISPRELEYMIDSLYRFVNTTVTANDFTKMSMEDFNNAKKNFNIPSLGKLYTSELKFKELNKIK